MADDTTNPTQDPEQDPEQDAVPTDDEDNDIPTYIAVLVDMPAPSRDNQDQGEPRGLGDGG